MKPGRDSQRALVYEAEQLVRNMFDRADDTGVRTVELIGSEVTLPVERRFASIESIQDYVDRVLALNWVRARWERASVPVHVRARAGNSAAHYESDCAAIAVPEYHSGTAWAFRELVVLHELAHHLDPSHPDDPGARVDPAHGPEFLDRYLTLVSEIIGPESGFVLRATLTAAGVTLS
ncbi:TIGR04338 family metallohydrolase [Rhodococcus sp. NPDC058521]|uniref:TIGR04338 family metallohydrolase n=1 Tax=Rhodococcus sp. NPDC058521 TaxID=3346536 RepID=UPI00364941D6